MNFKLRCALYARVSKENISSEAKIQDPSNQLIPMRKFANAMDWDIRHEFIDYASGGSSNRPEFQRMLNEVRQRHVDIILVWALDRFSREGILNTLKYMQELKKYKCALKSMQEQWLDTSDSGVGELLLLFMAWFAEQERLRISERTKAGLEKKRKQGVRLGRPFKYNNPKKYKFRIIELRSRGWNLSAIAREVGVSWDGAKKILQENGVNRKTRILYKSGGDDENERISE